MRYRQRVAHRHGGINGIPALLEDIHPHLSGSGVHRRYYSLFRAYRVEDIFLHTIRDGRRRRRGGGAGGAAAALKQLPESRAAMATRRKNVGFIIVILQRLRGNPS